MAAMRQDFVQALRVLRKQPAFTAVALTMLALGIGANVAIFSLVNAVVFRPLPFPDPDRLMVVHLLAPDRDAPGTYRPMIWSYPKYQVLREQQQIFDSTGDLRGLGVEPDRLGIARTRHRRARRADIPPDAWDRSRPWPHVLRRRNGDAEFSTPRCAESQLLDATPGRRSRRRRQDGRTQRHAAHDSWRAAFRLSRVDGSGGPVRARHDAVRVGPGRSVGITRTA